MNWFLKMYLIGIVFSVIIIVLVGFEIKAYCEDNYIVHKDKKQKRAIATNVLNYVFLFCIPFFNYITGLFALFVRESIRDKVIEKCIDCGYLTEKEKENE